MILTYGMIASRGTCGVEGECLAHLGAAALVLLGLLPDDDDELLLDDEPLDDDDESLSERLRLSASQCHRCFRVNDVWGCRSMPRSLSPAARAAARLQTAASLIECWSSLASPQRV